MGVCAIGFVGKMVKRSSTFLIKKVEEMDSSERTFFKDLSPTAAHCSQPCRQGFQGYPVFFVKKKYIVKFGTVTFLFGNIFI